MKAKEGKLTCTKCGYEEVISKDEKEQMKKDLENLRSSYRQARLDEIAKREEVVRSRIEWWQEQEKIRLEVLDVVKDHLLLPMSYKNFFAERYKKARNHYLSLKLHKYSGQKLIDALYSELDNEKSEDNVPRLKL